MPSFPSSFQTSSCKRLTDFDQYDFAAWYGLANCLSRDDAVQRDSTSPSGWRFRTSYEQSTRAYERAFQLVPSILRAQRGSSYESLRRLLKTSTNALRFGRGLSSGAADFAAYPLWQGDTLAFVPYPTKEILSRPWAVSEATSLAVRHQRERFHDIATSWVAAYPRSADAMEALAIALELLGDPSALDTLRRARAVASSPGERVRAAGSEVWMRVKFSVPSDLVGLQSARALADSQLRSYALAEAPEPEVLASLAALTGRAQLAAALKRPTEVPAGWEGPPELEWMAVRLLTFAALGGPVDSLRVLERTVGTTIDRSSDACLPGVPVPITARVSRDGRLPGGCADGVRAWGYGLRSEFVRRAASSPPTPATRRPDHRRALSGSVAARRAGR